MHALSIVTVDGSGARVLDGTLFRAPAEFFTRAQMRSYIGASAGWSRCPIGYDVLTRVSSSGNRFIVPAINLKDTAKPKRTFPDYRPIFDRRQIEAFLNTIMTEDNRVEESRNKELANLTHDLRAFSTEIYHAAEMARSNLENENYEHAATQVGTVLAAQQMVSLRLDIVDYSTGKAFEQEPERIPVYKKVDKVYRCFLPKASVRNQELLLMGHSRGYTYGPPLFELIPFVIVGNAMKYSPDRIGVYIDVAETHKQIEVKVISHGPKILPREAEMIFEKGFRGESAQASGQSGSGLGLYAAKSLVEQTFGGTLSVHQENTRTTIDARDYYRTTFSVIIPRVA